MSKRTLSKAEVLDELLSRQRSERRRATRYTLPLPVQVTGVDNLQRQWREAAVTVNVGTGGIALRMTGIRQVMVGDILHVEMEVPARLLKGAQTSTTHKSFARVRFVEKQGDGQQIVRLQFVGNEIPMR